MSYPDSSYGTSLPDANTLLGGGEGKYRSLSFANVRPPFGYEHMTVLALPKTLQSRDDDFNLEFWNLPGTTTPDRNSPKIQIRIKLRLAPGTPPDPQVEDYYGEDDLIRYWFIPGSGKQGSRNGFDALRSALRVAKVRVGVQPGGDLSVTFVEQGAPESSKKSGKKYYEAAYAPPPANWVDPLRKDFAGNGAGESPPPEPPAYEDDEPPF